MTNNQPKKLGGWLTFWLVMYLLGFALILSLSISSFLAFNGLSSLPEFGGVAVWAVPLLIICSIVGLASSIALLKWRKWGFYAICLLTAVACVTQTIYSLAAIPLIPLLLSIFSVIILYSLLRPKWKQFHS